MDAVNTKPPRHLGPYELLARLGTGGMAVVYLGRRTGESGFSRLFAIKVLHPHLAEDEQYLKMLLEEARIAARLHHLNVVPVVDLGSDAGLHYIVMDYVEGCSLVALLRRNRDARSPRILGTIMLDVLAGLHAAHVLDGDDGEPLDLVHRDVTPHNVLVGIDGGAHLTDFGIARIHAGDAHTATGHLKGKMHYLSPEQVLDESVDRRSDIFSAGAMMWSALTGRSLFRGKTDAATLHNILESPVAKPSSVGFEPPEVFDDLLLKALQRDPNLRYSAASEMEDAVRDALAQLGGPASRREIAQWVEDGFGTELMDRRQAVREVSEGSLASQDISLSSSLPPVDTAHSGPASTSRSTSVVPLVEAPHGATRRPSWVTAVSAVALLGLGGLIAVNLVQVEVATASAGLAFEVKLPTPAATGDARAPASAAPEAPTSKAIAQPTTPRSATPPRVAAAPRRAVPRPRDAAKPSSRPRAEEPTQPPKNGRAKPNAWDRDSPLLPP